MSNKKFNILSRIFLITLILTSLSACNLIENLFSKVQKSDFEKRPNYAINKSLYFWKELEDYRIDLKFSINNKINKTRDSFELSLMKDKDKEINQKSFSINFNNKEKEILRTKGYLLTEDKVNFLTLNKLISSDRELQLLSTDSWLELDLEKDVYKSKWLKLLIYKAGIFDRRNSWNELKYTKILTTEKINTGKLDKKDAYIANIEIDKDELTELTEELFDNLEILTQFFPNNLAMILNENYKISGRIWINQETFLTEKIDLNMESEEQKIEIEVKVNPKLENTNKLEVQNAELISKYLS